MDKLQAIADQCVKLPNSREVELTEKSKHDKEMSQAQSYHDKAVGEIRSHINIYKSEYKHQPSYLGTQPKSSAKSAEQRKSDLIANHDEHMDDL